jgi:hypothetical protein
MSPLEGSLCHCLESQTGQRRRAISHVVTLPATHTYTKDMKLLFVFALLAVLATAVFAWASLPRMRNVVLTLLVSIAGTM